ncbi:MAG: hypothetical protein QM487_14680 [Candidatus Marithrix sp.]
MNLNSTIVSPSPSVIENRLSNFNNNGSGNNYIGPNRLQFITDNYLIQENGSVNTFQVIRLGNTDKAVSAQYTVNSSTATEGKDYILVVAEH